MSASHHEGMNAQNCFLTAARASRLAAVVCFASWGGKWLKYVDELFNGDIPWVVLAGVLGFQA